MKLYEMMYILKPYYDDFVNQYVERVIKLISSNGGVVVKNEVWGYRMLAYPIKKMIKVSMSSSTSILMKTCSKRLQGF